MFSAVQIVTSSKPSQSLTLDEEFLILISWILIVVSTGLAFLVTLLDGYRNQIDLKAELADDLNKLDKNFDKLGGNNG